MINLVSPEKKRDIRAARINVVLVQYCVMLVMLALIVAMVYGLGFWIVNQEKEAVTNKLISQSEQSKAYVVAEKEAEIFRQNLSIAKQIIDKETSYSTFLTTLASDIPSGALLTNLSIGSAIPASKTQNGMTLDARASSYAKALETKTRLEQSSLFENVSIISASRPDDIGTLAGLSAKYPYEVSYNVKLSAQKPGGAAQ